MPNGAFELKEHFVALGLGMLPAYWNGEAGNLKPPLPAAERFVDLQYVHAAGINNHHSTTPAH
jgi:hypothetical protein